MNRFAQAIEVQDAVNLRAVARLLVEIADDAAIASPDTMGVRNDAAVKLTVFKLMDMCGINAFNTDDVRTSLSRAWVDCQKGARG
jgi:hypothetical protein